MSRKKSFTGDGKPPTVIEGDGDLPAALRPLDDPKKPAAVIGPHGFVANRRAYSPAEPTMETLLRANHAEWVEQFSGYMSLDTGVPMTAFRQGAITRLHWAAKYISFIDQRNASLQQRVAKLERDSDALSLALGKSERDLQKALDALAHQMALAAAPTGADVTSPSVDGGAGHGPMAKPDDPDGEGR